MYWFSGVSRTSKCKETPLGGDTRSHESVMKRRFVVAKWQAYRPTRGDNDIIVPSATDAVATLL